MYDILLGPSLHQILADSPVIEQGELDVGEIELVQFPCLELLQKLYVVLG